jgi:hypothetical protein
MPSFETTPLDSPITEFAIPLIAHKGEEWFAQGTAVIVGPSLALTTKHVVYDFYKFYENKDVPTPNVDDVKNIDTSFEMKAIQIGKDRSGLLWSIDKIWTSSITDAAFLRLQPMSEQSQRHEWRLPLMSLLPPAAGSEVHCFGYPHSKATLTGINGNNVHVRLEENPTTSIGRVVEVFNERRDSVQFPFACFQTDARFDGGMSGGPVFSDGKLCGLMCSNIPPYNDSDPHASFVASLWPAMATQLDWDRDGYPTGERYPVLELARMGVIKALAWEQVVVFGPQHVRIRY